MYTQLLASKNYWDIYIISRWAYKLQQEFISDELFDKIEEMLKKQCPDSEWFQTEYISDEEPTELLGKYNITFKPVSYGCTSQLLPYAEQLMDNRGVSVEPLRGYEAAYEWFQQHIGQELMFSVKINGINTKSIVSVKKGTVLASSSKALNAQNFLDYTDAVQVKYPKLNTTRLRNIKQLKDSTFVIACEAYVDSEGLCLLEQQGYEYKNPRSAAVGVLRRNLVSLIPNNFHLVCFSNLNTIDNFKEGIDYADIMGLETVPYMMHVYPGFKTVDEFKLWVDGCMLPLTEYADNIDMPYDGIVVQCNNLQEYYKNYTTLYNSSNIALKLGVTAAEELETVVEEIDLYLGKKSSVYYTPKIIVTPVTSKRDNITVTEITGYTLADIITRKLQPGSRIKILVQSGAYPTIK